MQIGLSTLSQPAAWGQEPELCVQEQVTSLNATELPFTDKLVPDPFATTVAAFSRNPTRYIFSGRRLQSIGPLCLPQPASTHLMLPVKQMLHTDSHPGQDLSTRLWKVRMRDLQAMPCLHRQRLRTCGHCQSTAGSSSRQQPTAMMLRAGSSSALWPHSLALHSRTPSMLPLQTFPARGWC